MKIFFTASYHGKENLQKYYDLIVETIQDTGVELVSPELGNYRKILKPLDMHSLKTEEQIHYEAVRKGILWADAVIFEVSHEDFQLGHEATLATQYKKPVLLLSLKEDYGKKIQNRFLQGAKYSKYNIKDLLLHFIIKNRQELLSERFNMFISQSQLKHLEVAGKTKGMNKSEYLRDLIEKDMTNQEE